MLVRIRFSAAALVAATAVLCLLFGAGSAWGQCTQITVTNNQLGAIDLILDLGAGWGTVTKSIPAAVPPVPGMAVVNIPVGASVLGVRGATGVFHAFAPQPPSPGCAMTPTGVVACIGLPATTPPPTVWCGSVCYDSTTCTITIQTCPVNICAP